MANLGGTFDATKVEPSEDRGALAPGEYLMAIAKSDIRNTKSGKPFSKSPTGYEALLEAELEVMDGPRKGARAWARLNLWNSNAQAVEIAEREFSAICHACGKLRVSDTSELHGILIVVRMGKRKDDPTQTEPKAFRPSAIQPMKLMVEAQPGRGEVPQTQPSAFAPSSKAPWAS